METGELDSNLPNPKSKSSKDFLSDSSNDSSSAEAPISTKIFQIQKALEGAIEQFKYESVKLFTQVILWGAACILMVFVGYNIISDPPSFPKITNNTPNVEIYYHVIVRITLITALFSLVAFLFKMFRTTLHLYQNNRHKLNVLISMPAFLSASNPEKENEIFMAILKIVIRFSNTGLINKESDFNNGISAAEKIINKKE